MVSRKTTAGKKGTSKLKLKKETIKDLDVNGKAGNVKGGHNPTVTCARTCACPTGKCPTLICQG